MTFIWNRDTLNWIFDIALFAVSYATILTVLIGCVKRIAPYVIFGISFVLSSVAIIFDLQYAFYVVISMTTVVTVAALISNIGDYNRFLANPLKTIKTRNGRATVEKLIDKKTLYSEIEKAVLSLAKSKTGAIITIEKNQPLKPFLTNGVSVNAPFSHELIETIFYEGTRLHDGAVVVIGDKIVSAAVFFAPSNSTFKTKLGARHRAAIGISQVSDALTIVVSEETGKISFAVGGELESVSPNNFLKVLTTYMENDED